MKNKTSVPKLHSIKFKSGAFAGDDVVYPREFRGENLPAINILEGAAMANLTDVVLIGYEPNGEEYIAGTMRCNKKAAYMFARGQFDMLRRGDTDDDPERTAS